MLPLDPDADPLVSIHAFRGEGDTHIHPLTGRVHPFQSTPSGGKATYW